MIATVVGLRNYSLGADSPFYVITLPIDFIRANIPELLKDLIAFIHVDSDLIFISAKATKEDL